MILWPVNQYILVKLTTRMRTPLFIHVPIHLIHVSKDLLLGFTASASLLMLSNLKDVLRTHRIHPPPSEYEKKNNFDLTRRSAKECDRKLKRILVQKFE